MYYKLTFSDVVKTSLMFSLLLNYGSVLSNFFPVSCDLLVIFLLSLLIIINRSVAINKNLIKIGIAIWFVAFLSMVMTGSTFYDYKGIFLGSLIVVLLIGAFKNDYQEIVKCFIRSLWILTYLSCINFALILFIPSIFILKTASIGYQVNTLIYLFNYLDNGSFTILGLNLIRNQSIFWEPGVLQIVINFLIFYILIERKQPFKYALLPIFIVLTTKSTTGFMVLMFILVVSFLKHYSSQQNKWKIFAMFCCIIAFVPILRSEFSSKMDYQETGNRSSIKRDYDLLIGTQTALNNPILGIGPSDERYYKENEHSMIQFDDYLVEVRSNSNGFTKLFYNYGFPIALFLLYTLYRQNLFKNRFVFFVIMIFSMNTEPLIIVYIYMLFFISAINLIPSHLGKQKIQNLESDL